MIFEYLKKNHAIGANNAIPTKEIERAFDIGKRTIARQVLQERSGGALICAKTTGKGGYYMPATIEEIEHQKDALERRIKMHALALKPFRAKLKEYKVKGTWHEKATKTGD